MEGVVDSGTDVTIMGGAMLKYVAVVAKLEVVSNTQIRFHVIMTNNHSIWIGALTSISLYMIRLRILQSVPRWMQGSSSSSRREFATS